jgi:sugar phosphate isomerase/epimerase
MTAQPAALDRRRFLQLGAAAAGLAAAPGLLAAARKESDPFGGFTLGMQSYTLRKFNVEQALKRIRDLGLRYVEFYPGQEGQVKVDSSPEQIKALLKLCKDYDVTPLAWGVQGFTRDDKKNEQLFAFGAALGLKAFSADPDPDSFDSLDKMCEKYNIAIAIHPHGPVGKDKLHRWYSAEVIMAAVKDHHPLIGACLDTGHLIRSNVPPFNKNLDPAKEVLAMDGRNFGMHLKDHDNKKDTDVPYGKGALDVPAVLKALREVKFKSLISIEYEAKPDDPTGDVKECLQAFQDAVKKLPESGKE